MATAQTLNITEGSVTYQFPASQTGDMTFNGGTSAKVTVAGNIAQYIKRELH